MSLHPYILANNDELVKMYRAIGEQGVAACVPEGEGDWPRSAYFLEHCTREGGDDGTRLVPRRFPTDGVVGLNVLLGEESHKALLRDCRGVFESFVDAIAAKVAPERQVRERRRRAAVAFLINLSGAIRCSHYTQYARLSVCS